MKFLIIIIMSLLIILSIKKLKGIKRKARQDKILGFKKSHNKYAIKEKRNP
ncbi:hypothetical protein HEMROJRC1_20610 [Rodentibacter sp. JRC1]|nr:hypothetical protein HEMROJRC1_20610 [Rodentibacter sp. JRC1]